MNKVLTHKHQDFYVLELTYFQMACVRNKTVIRVTNERKIVRHSVEIERKKKESLIASIYNIWCNRVELSHEHHCRYIFALVL